MQPVYLAQVLQFSNKCSCSEEHALFQDAIHSVEGVYRPAQLRLQPNTALLEHTSVIELTAGHRVPFPGTFRQDGPGY